MYKPLKFPKEYESKIFFWSDMHFSHDPSWDEPIWQKRGFGSVEEHDAVLVERWNNIVPEDGIVFHLGDIVFGYNGVQRLHGLFDVLKYKDLYLMPGNHHSGYKQVHDFVRQTLGNDIDEHLRLQYVTHTWPFEPFDRSVFFIPNYFEIYVGRKPIVLSHYPILSWNGMGHNSWHLFGHCHDSLKDNDWIKDNWLTGKCLDVGVENTPSPISFNEVKEYMHNQDIIKTSHHTKETSTPFC